MWIGPRPDFPGGGPANGAANPFPVRAVSKPIAKHGAGGVARPETACPLDGPGVDR
jgi:hypothetical protein